VRFDSCKVVTYLRGMKWHAWLFAIIGLCAVLNGAPRLPFQGDADGDAVRKTASACFLHIANGENDAAMAMIADGGDAVAQLQTYSKWIKAGTELRHEAELRIGPDDFAKYAVAPSLQNAARNYEMDLVVINDDAASIGVLSRPVAGMRLRRINNKWMVTDLAINRAYAKSAIHFIEGVTSADIELRSRIIAGTVKSHKEMDDAANEILGRNSGAAIMDEREKSASQPATRMSPGVDGETWRALLDHALNSTEFANALAKLPGLPAAATYSPSPGQLVITFMSSECGLSIDFNNVDEPATFRLKRVELSNCDTTRMAAFTGALPFGLAASDDRAAVEKKVGSPHLSSGPPYAAYFPEKGLAITYAGDDPRDPRNRIDKISLTLPDEGADREGRVHTSPRITFRLVREIPSPDAIDGIDPYATGAARHILMENAVELSEADIANVGLSIDPKTLPEVGVQLNDCA
jgi:hypothetical protein